MGAGRRLWLIAVLIGGVSTLGSGCYTSWLVRDPTVHLEPVEPQSLDSIPARARVQALRRVLLDFLADARRLHPSWQR
jgi:hypothetical protein